jgi:hypothetical protein
MTSIEVPDWVLEQAFNAWCDVADVDEWRVRNSHEALRAAIAAALGAWVVREPYRVGNRYMTQGGEEVTLNQVANYGTSYESMCDDAGVYRYTRRDFGRVTGSAHDYSDQRNIPPLFTLRQEKPE